MARLAIQADLDNYNPGIIANGQPPMVIGDWIFFLADRGVNGDIFHNHPLTNARNGANIWIEAGTYGSIQLGIGNYATANTDAGAGSVTSINPTTLTDGGSIAINLTSTGRRFEVGMVTKVVDPVDTNRWFMGTVQSYVGSVVTINNISQRHGNNASSTGWVIRVHNCRSDANNPCRMMNLGGRVIINRVVATREIEIWNIDYLRLEFESNNYPGIRDGWGSGRANTFGLLVTEDVKNESNMGIKIDNNMNTQKQLHIRGCEIAKGGFAKIRAMLSENHLTDFIIERNLINRSVGGEGTYIGQTSRIDEEGWVSFSNFKVRNNIISMTAAELLQLQEPANGSEFHNNVCFVGSTDYRSAFQDFQDTGVQIDMAQGGVKFYNNIVWGFGTNGIHLFMKDLSAQVNAVAFGDESPMFYNNAIIGAKSNKFIRTHVSLEQQPITKMVFRDMDFIDALNIYDDVDTNQNHHVELAHGHSPTHFINCRFPNDGRAMFSASEPLARTFNITRENVARPVFINSGFDGIDYSKITRWDVVFRVGKYKGTSGQDVNMASIVNGGTYTFAMTNNLTLVAGDKAYFWHRDSGAPMSFYATVASYSGSTLNLNSISDKSGSGTGTDWWDIAKRINYKVGEFVWLAIHGLTLEMNLYRCKVQHDSHDNTRPDLDTAKWELVQWDVNGKNMYDPLYNGTPHSSDFMTVAGDFRLVKGSEHHLLGRGLECNEQRDDMTRYGWQWKQTADGTIRDIPGAYRAKLILGNYSYLTPGRFYRFWVEPMNGSGSFLPRLYSEWKTIA